MFRALIPKVFYEDITIGLDLFVDGIGMEVLHRDETLAVLGRDNARVYLVEDAEFAAKDRPEISIETDSIEADYAVIAARRPDLLHPNLPRVTRREWGPRSSPSSTPPPSVWCSETGLLTRPQVSRCRRT